MCGFRWFNNIKANSSIVELCSPFASRLFIVKKPVHEDTRSGLYQDMHAEYRVDQTMSLTSS
ncbi:hypothetical protein JL09_g5222 [Pichia kudriavzevii]|uniref:Uncharacterized protein n=1 Tax=Pichia kudriavzevii TaxID=4909 RepID=A0A099NS40_PICKU|nr:hypothetical protein JL09_g5222 [Pichia kudriavzevii]